MGCCNLKDKEERNTELECESVNERPELVKMQYLNREQTVYETIEDIVHEEESPKNIKSGNGNLKYKSSQNLDEERGNTRTQSSILNVKASETTETLISNSKISLRQSANQQPPNPFFNPIQSKKGLADVIGKFGEKEPLENKDQGVLKHQISQDDKNKKSNDINNNKKTPENQKGNLAFNNTNNTIDYSPPTKERKLNVIDINNMGVNVTAGEFRDHDEHSNHSKEKFKFDSSYQPTHTKQPTSENIQYNKDGNSDDKLDHETNNENLEENYDNSKLDFSNKEDNQTIDCYEHSKEIFNYFNDMRMNPGLCISLVEEIIYKVQTDGDVDYLEVENLPYQGGGLMKGKYQLKNGKKGLKDLVILLSSIKDKSFEPILWSEKAYSKCELGIVNLNGLNIRYSDDEDRTENKQVIPQETLDRSKVHFKLQVQGILEGSFSASITSILLLAEESAHIREAFLTENFDSGACCYTISEEEYSKGITLMIFGIKKQREERLLETPTINTNELDLDDPIFSHIKYKEDIVSGEFRVDNGLLTAIFVLEDNSTKVERIVI